MSDVVYLYGFVNAGTPLPPPDLAGIAGRAVEHVELRSVRAVISRVPADAFAPAVIEARMQDLEWVGAQGLAHEGVVLWHVDHADILPARMFSLHSSEAALKSSVTDEDAIVARLAAMSGLREWNLKVAYDAAELGRHGAEVSDGLRALDAEINGAPPGRRYLLQKKRDDVHRRELSSAARRLAGELLDALRPHARAVRVLPLATTEENGAVVLNAALLVHRDAEAAMRAESGRLIDAQRALGMLPNLSGPWAPYRFMETDHA